MIIECNEISQTVNQLLIAFQDCNKILNSDLRKLVELVSAVNTCTNGGPSYDTMITVNYEPVVDQVVTYPVNSFHAYTLIVLTGSIVYENFNFPAGTVQNVEFTNLNQTPLTFTVKAGSQVSFQYIIETI